MWELASIPRWLLLNACPSKHSDVGPTSSRRHVDRQRPTVIFYLKFPIGTIPICQSYVNVTRECYVCNACFTYRSTAYKTFRTGRRITPPPSFSDVLVTCLWCITLGLHLRTVCQCIIWRHLWMLVQCKLGLSNRRALCVEIPRI